MIYFFMDAFLSNEVLIVIGLLVLLAVALIIAQRIERNHYGHAPMFYKGLREPSTGEDFSDPLFSDSMSDEPIQDRGTANQPRGGSTETGPNAAVGQRPNLGSTLDQYSRKDHLDAPRRSNSRQVAANAPVKQLLILHLMANQGETFSGQRLLDSALELGLRYGAMKIFHCHSHQNGSGPILFSLANLLNPGIFDLNKMSQQQCLGVTMFIDLDDVCDPVMAFDAMIATADTMAQALSLNIMDESRSSMTKQTTDHYRQQALNRSLQRQQNS